MAKSEINAKVDLKLLNKLAEMAKDTNKYYVKVGILAGKTNRSNKDKSSLNNAELGLIHEFGSRSRNIPARSFLRYPIQLKSKELTKSIADNKDKIIKAITTDKAGLKLVYKKLGVLAENIIQDAFSSQGYGSWKPNSPATIRKKKSSAPLIDTAQLRKSITSKVQKVGE